VLVDTPAFDIDLDNKEVDKFKRNIEAWKRR